MICENNLHPSINYTYEKAMTTRNEKGNSVQILIYLDLNVILNSKSEISADVHYKDTNSHDISCMTGLIQNPARKRILQLGLKIIVFPTDPEKIKLRLNELRMWLKNKYPGDIISNAFFSVLNFRLPMRQFRMLKIHKILSCKSKDYRLKVVPSSLQTPKSKNNFNNILFVTTFHKDTDIKFIMLFTLKEK